MKLTQITRSYSRSLNTSNINPRAAESWVKISAEYTAEIESTDNVNEVSALLIEKAMTDVAATVSAVSDRINASLQTPTPPAPTQPLATNTVAPRQL